MPRSLCARLRKGSPWLPPRAGGRTGGRAGGGGGGGVGWKKLRQIKGREKRVVATDTVQGMSAEAQGAGFAVVVFEVKASSAAL